MKGTGCIEVNCYYCGITIGWRDATDEDQRVSCMSGNCIERLVEDVEADEDET